MKRNIIANYVGTFWTAVVQILFVPAYIHYLGMEAYGLIGFYTTLQVWLMLLDFGLTPTINREMARFRGGVTDASYIRSLLHILELASLAVSATSFLAVATASRWLSRHWFNLHALTPHEVRSAIVMMGSVVVVRWMNNFYRGALQGLQKQVWLNSAWVFFVSLRSIGVIAILAWVSPTITAYFVYQCAVSVAEAVVMRIGVIGSIPRVESVSVSASKFLQEHVHFAGGMALLGVLGVAISQSDKIILSKMLPLKEFGYYALATTIANGLLAVAVPVFSAVTPKLTEDAARGDLADLVRNYHAGTDLLAILVYPLSAMLIFLGAPLVAAWSGSAPLARQVVPYLAPLALGTGFYCLAHMPYGLQLAYARTRLLVVLNAVTVAVLIPVLVVLVPRHGPMIAAAAWAFLNAIGLAVQVFAVHRRLLPEGQNHRWLRLTFMFPGAAVLVLFGGARLLFDKVLAGTGPLLSMLFIAAVTTIAVAAVALIVPTGRQILAQLGAWTRRRIQAANTPPPAAL